MSNYDYLFFVKLNKKKTAHTCLCRQCLSNELLRNALCYIRFMTSLNVSAFWTISTEEGRANLF